MPRFDTPEPISVTVELGVGDIQVVAGARTDTVVEVRPSDATKSADVAAAAQTRVDYADGMLQIQAPKGWRLYTPRGGADSIAVRIELPAGSHLHGTAAIGALRCTGRLGGCQHRAGVGDIHVDEAGPMELKTGSGAIVVGRAVRHADITTGSGVVRIGTVDGTAAIKNANGDTWIGEISGDLRVSTANGTVVVDRAHASVAAKTANGDIRLGEVSSGTILGQTSRGSVDIGIGDGVAAWLDLHTSFGNVETELDSVQHPEPGEAAVEVRGRTAYGDVSIRRALTRELTKHTA